MLRSVDPTSGTRAHADRLGLWLHEDGRDRNGAFFMFGIEIIKVVDDASYPSNGKTTGY